MKSLYDRYLKKAFELEVLESDKEGLYIDPKHAVRILRAMDLVETRAHEKQFAHYAYQFTNVRAFIAQIKRHLPALSS